MSSIVLLEKAIVTATDIAEKKATEQSLKSILPIREDRATAKLLIRIINDNVIKPILKEEPLKIAKTFDDSVDLFGIIMMALEQLILKNNRDRIPVLFESVREFYQQGTQSIHRYENLISESSLEQIREIVGILQGYQDVIIGILMRNRDLPADSIAAMSQEEGLTSLYGTILSIFCMFKLVNATKYHDQRKLDAVISVGRKYAQALDGYSDTIDILTCPEEMELMNRAEKL